MKGSLSQQETLIMDSCCTWYIINWDQKFTNDEPGIAKYYSGS